MIAADTLARFVPLDTLSSGALRKAAELARERRYATGEVLFRQGDEDGDLFFLLEGEVALATTSQDPPLIVRHGSDTARHPLARLRPRRYTATARTPVTVAVIDDDHLDDILTTDQTAAYEVTEFDGEDPEWMFRLLSPPAFQRVPTKNLADRKSTRLNSSHNPASRMPSSA
jgi:CRP-like cAMP-binding protein